jgi:hypothetical protein
MPRRVRRSFDDAGIADSLPETEQLQAGEAAGGDEQPQQWIFYCKYASFRIMGDGFDVSFVHNRAVVTDEATKNWLCSQRVFGGTAPHFKDTRGGSPVYWLGGYPQWYIDKVRERNEQLILDPGDINEEPLV